MLNEKSLRIIYTIFTQSEMMDGYVVSWICVYGYNLRNKLNANDVTWHDTSQISQGMTDCFFWQLKKTWVTRRRRRRGYKISVNFYPNHEILKN
jgi:hypothetical protein